MSNNVQPKLMKTVLNVCRIWTRLNNSLHDETILPINNVINHRINKRFVRRNSQTFRVTIHLRATNNRNYMYGFHKNTTMDIINLKKINALFEEV